MSTATIREVLAGGMIKGAMMAAHLEWAISRRSAADITRFWNAVPADVAKRLKGIILPVNWYEFSDLIAIDRAIMNAYSGGDIRVLRDVGAYSARINLTGVYRVFKRDSIHDFLDSGARLHSKFQDFGVAKYMKTSPTSGDVILSAYRSYSPLFCESAVGFYRESLTIHGAKSVNVDERACQCIGGESCTFSIQWD
jgi:hypothetical protein